MPITISVSVNPRASTECVTPVAPGAYRVSVRAAPHDGKANLAVVEILSDYFSVPKSKIKIIRGHGARKKLLAIG